MSGLVYIGAPNDSSGNPRRGWIVGYDGTRELAFVEERYEGAKALERHGIPKDDGRMLPLVNVSASEYRSWVKLGTPAAVTA